jgi:magnesium transporter
MPNPGVSPCRITTIRRRIRVRPGRETDERVRTKPDEPRRLRRRAQTVPMTHERPTVRTRLWRDGALEAEDFPFERISDHLDEDGALVWVDICDPDPQRLSHLADELALDPHAVEDALGRAERAKATRYATHTFLTVYAVQSVAAPAGETVRPIQDSRLKVSRVSAFVLRRGMVTVHEGAGFDMAEVVERWEENSDLLKFGVGALVHGLLDTVVDGHFQAVQSLDDAIESLEDGLFDDRALDRETQRRTYRVRKDLVELRRVVLPMREVVNAVLRHRKDFNAPTELDTWYDDLYDHVLRASEWTESLRDMVGTLFETNLSLQDARLNNVMKKLTAWAAIIAVPTAVTGYFGQNVPYPGFAQPSGFWISNIVIVVFAVVLYLGFRRRGWI